MYKIIYNILSNRILGDYNAAKVRASAVTMGEFPYDIEVIAEGLFVPWAIAISEDGKIYVTERSGTIRIIEDGKLLSSPLITMEAPFAKRGEGGLLGIALDPDFDNNHYIYVMHSYTEGGKPYSRVIRLVEQNNTASIDQVILDKIPGGITHLGGRIKIGPDQKLYITTGDIGKADMAQDLTSMAGKILRIELDGSIPEDNPIPNSPIYSFGHRNPQGLAWNGNNILYASEHGATAHDEINIIQSGVNYGWPMVQGDEESADIKTQNPFLQSESETWAPAGITFINQGPWNGKLLVATLRGVQLLAITLNEQGNEVEQVESWLKNEYGRLREIIETKDGTIYLTTSNRDGRGDAETSDDKVLRLIPKK